MKSLSMRSCLILLVSLVVGCASSTAGPPCAALSPSAERMPRVEEPDDGLAKLTEPELARKMLEIMGATALRNQMGDAMVEMFRKMPNLPPGFVDRFKQNMRDTPFTEAIVAIYVKHYDRAVMTAAIRFYQSEQGQKLVKSLPVVTTESMEAGKAWGTEVAKKTMKELQSGAAPP